MRAFVRSPFVSALAGGTVLGLEGAEADELELARWKKIIQEKGIKAEEG